MSRVTPGLLDSHPHPHPLVPVPVTPTGFWSKRVQKHDFWTRNEGDIADLNKSPISHSVLVQKHDFWTRNEGDIADLNKSPISHSVLVQKLCFWTLLKADGSGFHDPYPYPRLPVPVTRTGSKTRDIP